MSRHHAQCESCPLTSVFVLSGIDECCGCPAKVEYPSWICSECGNKHGRPSSATGLATFHEPNKSDYGDHCGWCGSREKWLTEPRDYGYPPRPSECSG